MIGIFILFSLIALSGGVLNQQKCEECSNLSGFWTNLCKKAVLLFKNAVNEAKKLVCRLSQLDELVDMALALKENKMEKIMEYAKNEDPPTHQMLQQLIDAFQKVDRVNLARPFGDEHQYDTVHSLTVESAHYLEHRFGIPFVFQFSSDSMDFGAAFSKIVPIVNLMRNHFIDGDQKKGEGDERHRWEGGNKQQQQMFVEEERSDGGGANGIFQNWANSSADGKDKRRQRRKKRDLLGPAFLGLVLAWALTVLLIFIINCSSRVVSFVKNQMTRISTRHVHQSRYSASSSSGAASGASQRSGTYGKSRSEVFDALTDRTVTENGAVCSICLVEIEPGSAIKQLPSCIHNFHTFCIKLWLQTKIDCPICRAKIFKTNGQGLVALNYQPIIYGTFSNA